MLKALLEDEQGMAAGLIARAGGSAEAARRETDEALAKIPAVSGSGASAAPALDGETIRLLDQAEQIAQKAGDSYVTVERMLLALVLSNTDAGKALARCRPEGGGAERGDQRTARRPQRRHARAPRTATTRSRSSPATSPRRRATASSIR